MPSSQVVNRRKWLVSSQSVGKSRIVSDYVASRKDQDYERNPKSEGF
jgi:hypothetical protein